MKYLELLQNSYCFPLLEKMMRATSASHRTESSYAFFKRPFLLFANVTCLLILFSILFNSTLPLPIFFYFPSLSRCESFIYMNEASLSSFFLFFSYFLTFKAYMYNLVQCIYISHNTSFKYINMSASLLEIFDKYSLSIYIHSYFKVQTIYPSIIVRVLLTSYNLQVTKPPHRIYANVAKQNKLITLSMFRFFPT